MHIVRDFPPNFDAIAARFPQVRGRHGVLFAWGGIIFNPSGVTVSRELHAHEEIHGARQGADVADWWAHYLRDDHFRLIEELAAHREEYRAYCKRHGSSSARREYLRLVAERLASPLYGELITPEQAVERIVVL